MTTNQSCKKSPLQFLLLLLVLSIPFWILGAIAGNLAERLPINLPLSALMAICPIVAALILVHSENKLSGIRELLKRTFDYKRIQKKIWYLPSIFMMPGVMLLSYIVMGLIVRPLPVPDIQLIAIPILFIVFF